MDGEGREAGKRRAGGNGQKREGWSREKFTFTASTQWSVCNTSWSPQADHTAVAIMGGATVLKVGREFCERSEQNFFFEPPLFGQWGTKYCLDIAKSA